MSGTVEDCADKWCPFARVYNDHTPVAVNRSPSSGTGLKLCRCIGSSCMAWRWVEPHTLNDGYCGLVGDPIRNVGSPAKEGAPS